MIQSSTNCLSQSRWKSCRSLDASSRASSRSTVSWQNRKLPPSNQTTTYSPSGPSPTGQRWRLRSWSTRLPLWWPNLGEPSVSFLDSHSYLFGTILVPWKDYLCYLIIIQCIKAFKGSLHTKIKFAWNLIFFGQNIYLPFQWNVIWPGTLLEFDV